MTVGITVGLVCGKALGITETTFRTAKLTRAQLDADLNWVDVAGVALLGGIGCTVSLLIGELAVRGDHVRIGVLLGTLTAALPATLVLRFRNRAYRVIAEHEARDEDSDGIPDMRREQQLPPFGGD